MSAAAPSKLDSLYKVCEQRIIRGEWPVGKTLPTEHNLAAEFGCSRSTIGKVVGRLAHEGLVERRKKAGTRVVRDSLQRAVRPSVELDALAFVYPSNKHESIWQTVSGFQDAARDAGRRTLTLTTASDYRKDAEVISRLDEFDVKGACIYPSISTPEEFVFFQQALLRSKVPTVLTTHFPGMGCPSVVVDGWHAGYTMTRHLIERGARHIGFFCNAAWTLQMRDRHRGYRRALEEADLREPGNGVFLEKAMHVDFRDPVAESKQIARDYLRQRGELDAVCCGNDLLAIGLVTAAGEIGLKVPDDLRVTGIDDISLAAASGVSLTTYHPSFEERGRIAFNILEGLCAGKAPDRLETSIRGHLVIRDSA